MGAGGVPKDIGVCRVGGTVRHIAAVLLVCAVAAPASADVVFEPRIQSIPSIRLASVIVSERNAPVADVTRVQRETRAQLHRRQRRIERCMAGVDTRRDPLRSRDRVLSGRLVFQRSGRPTLHIDRSVGVPRAARSCIEEALRGINIRTAPRGNVEIRFRYTIR